MYFQIFWRPRSIDPFGPLLNPALDIGTIYIYILKFYNFGHEIIKWNISYYMAVVSINSR